MRGNALAGPWLCLVVSLLAASAWCSVVSAEPREVATGGVDSALTDGAVVATAESGAAIWYNPASLVSVETGSVDLSGSLYSMSLSPSGQFLTLDTGERDTRRELSFRVVPRALTLAMKLADDVVLAGGLFNSLVADQTLRADVLSDTGGSSWSVVGDRRAYALHFAVAVGWSLSERLSLGASLDAVYVDSVTTTLVASSGAGGVGEAYSMAEHDSWGAFGPQARLGLRYLLERGYRVGFSYSTPTWGIYQNQDLVKTHAGPGDGRELSPAALGTSTRAGATSQQLEHGRLRVGVAKVAGDTWIALDGDLRMPLRSELRPDEGWGGSLRLGGIQRVSRRVRLGGALFTSLNQRRSLSQVGAQNTDYVGVNLGIDVSNSDVLAAVAKTQISLAIATSYTYGYGARAGVLAASDAQHDAPSLTRVGYRSHDLAINLALKASR